MKCDESELLHTNGNKVVGSPLLQLRIFKQCSCFNRFKIIIFFTTNFGIQLHQLFTELVWPHYPVVELVVIDPSPFSA